MKPTQEQVIAWANEVKLCGCKWVSDDDDRDVESLCDFAALAYEAGRKDENEACAEMVKNWKPEFFKHMTQEYAVHFIRARREQ